jgi:outer membrane protein
VLSRRPARDDGVEDAVVRLLRKVDATGEAGLFVEYSFGDTLTQGDRLSVGLEVRGGKGNQLTWGVSYLGAKRGAFQYGVDLRTTYANDKYMDTCFSVDADKSLRSGLPVYKASAGLKSTSIGFTASVDLARQWTLVGRLGALRLAGDASDSPIVRLRDDASSTAFGLALGYRF